MIAEVCFQSPPKIYGQPYVVELAIFVKRVNALAVSDILLKKLLVFLYRVATNSFQILSNKGSLFCHVLTS
jgi:hypothetical protein